MLRAEVIYSDKVSCTSHVSAMSQKYQIVNMLLQSWNQFL